MKRTKVLVTGASGLVGSRFVEMSQSFDFFTPDLDELDLTNLKSVQAVIEKYNPDWVVNFAAFTDVNAAEEQFGDETGLAWKINVGGVQNLVDSFKSRNIIHISTDMVFPGNIEHPGPYAEADTPPDNHGSLTWYGWTKNRAEKIIRERQGTILRIIYPVRTSFANKLDYIRGALKKFVDGKMYPLFHDQQISVAFIDDVATALQRIIETEASGVFHVSSDTTTPHELISYVIRELGEDHALVKSASIHDFLATQNNPNRYPVWGGLKTKHTEETLDIHISTWQTIIERLIGQGLNLPEKS